MVSDKEQRVYEMLTKVLAAADVSRPMPTQVRAAELVLATLKGERRAG